MDSLTELRSMIDAEVSEGCGQRYSPRPFYQRETDSLFCVVSDELSFRKRVNRLLSVFISDESGEVVGIQIKGFKRVFDNMRRFKVDGIVEAHPTLGLFLCMVVTSPEAGHEWLDDELTALDKYTDVSIPLDVFAGVETCEA